MKSSITERIFDIIEKNPELNQSRLAQTLGVERAVINQWKTGKSKPSPKLILKILFHFPEVDANWLIRGEEIKKGTTYGISMNNQINENQAQYKQENEHLKEIINEKNEQINLLKEMLNFKK